MLASSLPGHISERNANEAQSSAKHKPKTVKHVQAQYSPE